MWKGRSCLLSLGSDLDYLVTHTNLHPISIHPSTSHRAPPPGHIMSRACEQEPGGSRGWRFGGGGGQTVRLARRASAGVFLCLPCLSLSVYLQRLSACPFPEGFVKGEKCDAATRARVMVESVCSGHVVCMCPPTHLHLLLFYLSKETPGARRGITPVSGMLGRHFPGLHLRLISSTSDTRSFINQILIICLAFYSLQTKSVKKY